MKAFDYFRLIPRQSDFLSRKIGSNGEIFYDAQDNTLRLYDGHVEGGIPLLRADLENIEGVIGAALGETPPTGVEAGTLWFNTSTGKLFVYYNDGNSSQWVQPTSLIYGGGSGGSSGASAIVDLNDVSITSPTAGQVLKFNGNVWVNGTDDASVGGGGGGATTIDELTDVVISSVENGQILRYNGSSWINDNSNNSFSTISVAGQLSIVAEALNDTLTLVAGTNISITTNAANDSITISSTGATTSYNALTDAISGSSTIDKVYMPAITMLTVTNSGASAYLFDQYPGSNPTIYAISGTTIAFNLNVIGHPFFIQTGVGTNFSTGLVHVSTSGTVLTGGSAQGQTQGTLYWKIPSNISGGYRYQCGVHAAMVGSIFVKDITIL